MHPIDPHPIDPHHSIQLRSSFGPSVVFEGRRPKGCPCREAFYCDAICQKQILDLLGLPKTARPPNQRFSRRSIVSGWCGTEESFAKDPEVQLYQLLPRLDQLLQGLHQALEHA